ncbi:MAG: phosphoribosylformylglycinamidine cyclo-ligase [Nitrospinaceae bacterium]|jgi:phosphoribosylformylglycinamidine cyclo-ligase|nr:phosphoribosylformylglycinamidine cyclo-ligase [Nitrospinaceae bacterium]
MSDPQSDSSSQYEQSGVSSRGAEDALSGLLEHVLPTRKFAERFPLAADIGYFANVIDVGNGLGIAFGTDGVGTKIIVAELMDRYDTIGIDCVAMNVNDLICVGARPVSMVDYIGCSFTDARIFSEIGKGLAEGARQGEISISGGEISQIKEIIKGVDLIGACIGSVPLEKVNTGKDIQPGNMIIGLASSGVHSNGLTLARKVLLGETREEQEKNVNKFEERLGRTLGEELLEPTRIYVKPIMEMLDAGIDLKAMVHLTSGGYSNLNRVENDNIRFVIDPSPPVPEVFKLIQERGKISDAEMYEVFNMGTGFVVIVESMKEIAEVTAICKKYDIASNVIGVVEPCQGKEVTIPEHGLVGKGQKITSA